MSRRIIFSPSRRCGQNVNELRIEIEFDLRFECGHTAKIPLIHSQDHANCFVCHPELRDQVSPGMCSACVVDEYERKRNEEK